MQTNQAKRQGAVAAREQVQGGRERAPLSLPIPSMPKGGGAVRAIGEKVSVNPATGVATLSIPVPTPPGRQGFGPELTLAYSSGGGNGPFGLGWSLSVPSITRKTEKGLPRYTDAVGDEQADTLILAGAEDLVPAFRETADGWEVDQRQVTEGVEQYLVRRYRPRTEGGFLRIERWEQVATGETHWRTISPQNVTEIYGRSASCRIADPADANRVFSWLLEERADALGNLISYAYKAEDTTGIDTAASAERNRLGAQANRYLKRIRYGNRTPGVLADPLFEVLFDYGDHDESDPTPVESREWPCRSDAFSSHRAGFEIRTRRLCRRVLLFHHFAELGPEPRLVSSIDLAYDERPDLTRLVQVTERGYIPGQPTESLPPLDLQYTAPSLDETVRTAETPQGIDGGRFHLVDLDGEGAPGILTEEDGAWYYAANLGGGRFGEPRPLPTAPSLAHLRGGRQQLLNLAGDGRTHLVQFGGEAAGYYARTPSGTDWESFVPFDALPQLNWQDPNLRFLDLDGDGLADLLLAGEELFTWYPSRGPAGFGPAERARQTGLLDEERGPNLLFAGQAESIFLADMDGDGLTDLVRIRNGEVCFWPNQGYGRFGPKVTMDHSPHFDFPDRFDPARLRLADLDGSGPTDLLYLGGDRVTCWFNQAGNSWSEGRALQSFPETDRLATVMVADLLGAGTACLVWSSPLPGNAGRTLRYLDLMGGTKPHLLARVIDNMGGEVQLEYAPSTRFYFADQQAGRPWIDRLPFPVHVLTQVEHLDHVALTQHVTRYAYRHGYYDGAEREFRGFGAVDQWDAESFVSAALAQLPVRTRTWFHTGGWPAEAGAGRYSGEYWQGDPQAWRLAEGAPPARPDGSPLSAAERCEAQRTLGGRVLRQEVYAEDGWAESIHPYSVTQYAYDLVCIQPQNAGPLTNRHGVFQALERESLTCQYERNPADPRVQHHLVLQRDRYSNVLAAAAVGYGRRHPAGPAAAEQARTAITCSISRYANRDDQPDWYRLGVLWEQASYELTGLTPPVGRPFTAQELWHGVTHATDLAYEAEPTEGLLQKRLIQAERHDFYRDDLTGPLPLGDVSRLALPYSVRTAALTPGLVTALYGSPLSADLLTGGYRLEALAGEPIWWATSGHLEYDPARFYQPVALVDPWSNRTTVEYDPYALLVTATHDSLPAPFTNTVRVQYNYRVLAPWQQTDPNGNRTALRYDGLGRVTASAVMGKPSETAGDFLAESSPESLPSDQPTTRTLYDTHAWHERGQPCSVTTQARLRHGDPATPWQSSVAYQDGSGRTILIKAQAEPGLAPYRDAAGALVRGPDGSPLLQPSSTRWTGTGRVVLNNKGLPVKQYEPYFMSDAGFDREADLVAHGVTPVLEYDPPGRLVRADLPDGTFKRAAFTPWEEEAWDRNDTVAESQWLADRQGLPESHPEAQVVQAVLAHANTPGRRYLDALGRPVVTVTQSGPETFHATRTRLDIAGNPLAVIDARGHTVLRQRFDLLGRPLWQESADAGERLVLLDCAGQPLRSWRGDRQCRWEFDALRRPTHRWVRNGAEAERLAALTLYGERHPDAAARNLKGQSHQHYDGAGVAIAERYDFKGNLVDSRRAVARSYRDDPDWSPLAHLVEPAQAQAAAAPLLQSEFFTLYAEYDALNRSIRHERPDGTLVLPAYNEAGLLGAVHLQLAGSTEATPFVTAIAYDAGGQRQAITYGNGLETTYSYHPLTQRLARLVTRRPADGATLQDLAYTYDLVGNLLTLQDLAQQPLFFQNTVVAPGGRYRYDALYRLIYAEGREHLGQVPTAYPDEGEYPRQALPHPNDLSALRPYAETYQYDLAGNITEVRHLTGGTTAWRRHYAYAPGSNRLLATSGSGDAEGGPFSRTYSHDPLGHMIQMPHLPSLDWDEEERLVRVSLGGGGTAFYRYDAQGQRIRAVVERSGGGLVEERLYPAGGYERFRRTVAGSLREERHTNHVMDGEHRIALVERVTVEEGAAVTTPAPRIRYQVANHQGSACLEVDGAGLVLTYEEYYPFGGTAYHSAHGGAETSLKRYRYAGRERDAETGLDYYGARYYAPWLGRWTSADPAGMVEQPNLYSFVSNQPINRVEVGGFFSWHPAALADKLEAKVNALERRLLVEDRHVGTSLLNTVTATGATLARGTLTTLRIGNSAAEGVEQIQNAEDGWDVAIGVAKILVDAGDTASAAVGASGNAVKGVRTVRAARIERQADKLRQQRAVLQQRMAAETNRTTRNRVFRPAINDLSEGIGDLEAQKYAVKAGLADLGDTKIPSNLPNPHGVDNAFRSGRVAGKQPFSRKPRTIVTENKGRQAANWENPADELDQLRSGEFQGTPAYDRNRLTAAQTGGNANAGRILDRINNGSTHENFLVLADTNVGGRARLYRLTPDPAGGAPLAQEVSGFGSEVMTMVGSAALNITVDAWLNQDLQIH